METIEVTIKILIKENHENKNKNKKNYFEERIFSYNIIIDEYKNFDEIKEVTIEFFNKFFEIKNIGYRLDNNLKSFGFKKMEMNGKFNEDELCFNGKTFVYLTNSIHFFLIYTDDALIRLPKKRTCKDICICAIF